MHRNHRPEKKKAQEIIKTKQNAKTTNKLIYKWINEIQTKTKWAKNDDVMGEILLLH